MGLLSSEQVPAKPRRSWTSFRSLWWSSGFESESCFLQRHSLDETFLRDSVLERLKDEDPEVVAVTLRVLEVSEGNMVVSLCHRGAFTVPCFF